jgi:hypothetical protein
MDAETSSPLLRTLNTDVAAPAERIALNDGARPVTHISVLALYRNCADYLRFAFKQFSNWEARYDCQFSYYFIENDSKDSSRDMLKTFFKTHRGRLLAGKLDADYQNLGENFDRTQTLAKLRNALVDAVTPLDSQWTVFIDSNIFFAADVLERFFARAAPAANNIGMLTPYTKQVHTVGILKNLGFKLDMDAHPMSSSSSSSSNAAAESDARIVDLRAAFDTFSYHDANCRTHFPLCPFEKCLLCKSVRPKDYKLSLIPESQDVADMRSAFAGFALIDSDVLNHPRIRWQTLAFDHTGRSSVCEHVLFCDRLATVTGKRVVVVQSVDDVFRTY